MSSASVASAPGEHDERLDGLAPLLVGHADDGRLGDGRVLEQAVLDLDRRDVLAARDDHVLLAVGDRAGSPRRRAGRRRRCGTSRRRRPRRWPRAGPSSRRRRRCRGPGPRPSSSMRTRTPSAGGAGPAELPRPLGGRQGVPLRPAAVDRQQRRRLGEAVDLHELPAELGLDPLDACGRRRRAGDDDAHVSAPGCRRRPLAAARRGPCSRRRGRRPAT